MAVVVFCVLGVLSYSNTFNTPFVLDDKEHILENHHIRMMDLSINNFMEIFKSPAPNRPVANASFALNYYLHGYTLAGFHIFNLLIHIMSAILVYLIASETMNINNIKGLYLPFLASALWMVNPVHTQSVTYIVQRMTSLSSMFYLLSFLFYIKARYLYIKECNCSNQYVVFFAIISVVAGFAAIGSKEIAIMLPVFIALYEWFFFQDLDIQWVKRNWFWGIVILVVLVLAAFLFIGTDPASRVVATYVHRDFTLGQRLLTETRIVIFYLSLLLFPHPSRLNLDHDISISYSLVDPLTTLFSIITILLLIVVGFVFRKKEKLLSFSIIWFLGNLLIESSFIGLELIFEHRTYLPSVFLFITLTVLFVSKSNHQLIPVIIICICICICEMWTFQRNNIWKSEISLWRDCVEKSPEKIRPHLTLAIVLAENGQISEAIQHNKKVILLDPNNKKAHIELGTDLILIGDYDNGIEFIKKSLQMETDSFTAYYNLGIAYLCIGKIEKAIVSFEHALKLFPNNNNVLRNLKMANRFYTNIKIAAIKLGNDLAKIPKDRNNWDTADIHIKKQELDNAVEEFIKALSFQPGFKRESFSFSNIKFIQSVLNEYNNKISLYKVVN
jgi:protein O-mannosyl-transferase